MRGRGCGGGVRRERERRERWPHRHRHIRHIRHRHILQIARARPLPSQLPNSLKRNTQHTQAPAYFFVVLRLMKPFIDPITYSKVVLVSGEEEDEKMRLVIGEDWRELTGAGKERKEDAEGRLCSPGYNHAEAWERVLREEERAAEQDAEAAAMIKGTEFAEDEREDFDDFGEIEEEEEEEEEE